MRSALKVGKSRKQFMVLSILPKNERNSLSWASSLLRIVSSVRFLGELRRPKTAFDIYWPLQWPKSIFSKIGEIFLTTLAVQTDKKAKSCTTRSQDWVFRVDFHHYITSNLLTYRFWSIEISKGFGLFDGDRLLIKWKRWFKHCLDFFARII